MKNINKYLKYRWMNEYIFDKYMKTNPKGELDLQEEKNSLSSRYLRFLT